MEGHTHTHTPTRGERERDRRREDSNEACSEVTKQSKAKQSRARIGRTRPLGGYLHIQDRKDTRQKRAEQIKQRQTQNERRKKKPQDPYPAKRKQRRIPPASLLGLSK